MNQNDNFNQNNINMNESNVILNTQQEQNSYFTSDNSNEGINKQLFNNQNSKNKFTKLFSFVLCVFIIVMIISVLFVFNYFKKDGKLEEETINHETYRKIYSSSTDESFYVNDEEKVYSFSGYGKLGDYFYNNVNIGYLEGQYFLIDIDKKYVVKSGMYDYIGRASNSKKYYYVTKNDMDGVIDYTGKVVIPTEYTKIKHYEDDGLEFFIAQNNTKNENYLFSENGSLLLKTTENISSYEVEGFKPVCSKCISTILYDTTLYNANDGSILLENLDGLFNRNMYYKDNTLTIYDEKYNVKEIIDDIDIISLGLTQDGHPMVDSSPDLYLNANLELVDMEKEQEEKHKKFIKENGFAEIENGNYHIFSNKGKYITKVDTESNSIIIYDYKGNKLKSIEVGKASKIKKIYSLGNYFVATYGFYNKEYVFNVNGEWIVEDASMVTYNEDNGILYASYYPSDDFTLLHDNFELSFGGDYDLYETKLGFIIHDNTNKKVTFYDLNGKISNEFNNISECHKRFSDDYIFLSTDDGKHTIIDINDGKITLEYLDINDSNNVLNYLKYDEDNIAIIETSDGFYSPSGKKLIDKK